MKVIIFEEKIFPICAPCYASPIRAPEYCFPLYGYPGTASPIRAPEYRFPLYGHPSTASPIRAPEYRFPLYGYPSTASPIRAPGYCFLIAALGKKNIFLLRLSVRKKNKKI